MRALKSLAAIAALVAGLVVPVAASHATSATTVSPASGSSTSGITLTTSAGCTGSDANTYIQVFQTGPGFPDAGYSIRNKSKAELYTSGSGYVIPLGSNMQDAAGAQNPAATLGGKYTFTIKCYEGALTNAASETLGSADIWFTSTNAYVTTDPAVTTSVEVTPSASAVSNATPVTLTASMTPSNAVGSVEFFDGATSLGTFAVSAGTASMIKTFEADGVGRIVTHSITAVFTPTNALLFTTSTSAASSVVVTTPPAADTVSISPVEGTSSSAIDVFTTSACPEADASTKVQITMVGSGFPQGGVNVTPKAAESSLARSGAGYHTTLSQSMATFAAQQDPVATLDGQYTFTVKCFQGLGPVTAVIGSISIWFTSPTVYQSTEPTHGVATSLLLGISPQSGVTTGSTATLTATVTPTEAVGSVSFTATPTSGGGAPIALGTASISNGVATVTNSTLPGGLASGLPKSYRIDASFTPSSDAYFASTAESKTLIVYAKLSPANTVLPVLSAAKVGTALTCSRGTWSDASTYSIVIKVAGTSKATSTGTTASYTPVAADYNKLVTCRVTATSVDGLSATADATAKTVALGPALTVVSGKTPKVTGTLKTGKVLTATSGTWSPAASSFTYQWVTIASGKATRIANATKSTYTIAASMKGKTIGVIVTAVKSGYANGTQTVTAGKVS